jgi:hypothetical protein
MPVLLALLLLPVEVTAAVLVSVGTALFVTVPVITIGGSDVPGCTGYAPV